MRERYRFDAVGCPVCGLKNKRCSGFLGENGIQGVLCSATKPPDGWAMYEGKAYWNVFYANSPQAIEDRDYAFINGESQDCVESDYVKGQSSKSYKVNLTIEARSNAEQLLAIYNPVENKDSVAYKDLHSRNLSDKAIRRYGFIDLSGFVSSDTERWTWFSKNEQRQLKHYARSLFGEDFLAQLKGEGQHSNVTRFYVPAYDYSGNCVGWQARLYPETLEWIKQQNPDSKPAKYVWLPPTNHKHPAGYSVSSHLPEYGELPLTVFRSTLPKCDVVILTEGILKPLIVYEMLGRRYSVIGASGGNFTSCPKMLAGTLSAMQVDLGLTTVCLGADAGSGLNPNVQREYNKAHRFIEACGLGWQVLDWGQLEDDEAQDIDEIEAQSLLQVLPPVKSYELNSPVARFALSHMFQSNPLVVDYNIDKELNRLPYDDTVRVGADNINIIENSQQVLSIYMSKCKYILDKRPLGSGKSYSVPFVEPLSATGKIYYVSLSPRNPPTLDIEHEFIESPSRHGGLYAREGSYTPAGNPVYLRPREEHEGEELSEANCARAKEHLVAIKQSFSGNTLCQTCPHFQACSAGIGQYDYLYQKVVAADAQKVRIALSGINPGLITSEDTIIIDEPPSSAPFCEEYKIATKNSSYYLNQLELLLECHVSLVQRGTSFVFQFSDESVTEADLYNAAVTIDTSITEAALKAYQRTQSVYLLSTYKAGCLEFVSTLLDERTKMVHYTDDYILTIRPNMRLLDITKNAGKVIYLDATAEPIVFAAQYMIDPEVLVVIDQKDQAIEKVEVQVLAADNFNSRRKGVEQKKEVIAALKEQLTERHHGNIGYLSHSDYCSPGDIIFFSESRGSNKFAQREAICMFGLPQIDLGAMRVQWDMVAPLLSQYMSFRDYYNFATHSEIKQCIGRLRGFRREKQDTPFLVYVVANVRLNRLMSEGYAVRYGLAMDCLENGLALPDGYELFQSSEYESLESLCGSIYENSTDLTQALIKVNYTLSKLRILVEESHSIAKYGKFVEIPDALKEFGQSLDVLSVEDICSQVTLLPLGLCLLTARIISDRSWPQGLTYNQVRLLRLALAYRLRGMWQNGQSDPLITFSKHGYQKETHVSEVQIREEILRKLAKHQLD